jgi:ketosteroid isomerase-like protein
VSQENVEIVRSSFDAIARWDIGALLELYDPEVHFLPLTGTRVESGGYVGHSGVREYFEEVADVWEELRPYCHDFRTVGCDVVVLGGCAVRGRGSGAETDTPMAWVVTVRNGKITSHRGYRTGEEALEAVGLRE